MLVDINDLILNLEERSKNWIDLDSHPLRHVTGYENDLIIEALKFYRDIYEG